jgi:inosine-uridine nucleoside N-ribohydrolase
VFKNAKIQLFFDMEKTFHFFSYLCLMKQIRLIPLITLAVTAMALSSCATRPLVSATGHRPPALIILDTDIGSSTDDLFAIQLLHAYQREGRCRILGVVVDRMGDSCAMLADMMNTYYGRPKIPLGVERHGIVNPRYYIDQRGLAGQFARSVSRYDTLPDGHLLYRRLLAEADDHSVTIVAIGFASSLAQLLESQPDSLSPLNGIDLVARKVKAVYLMGTKLGESNSPGYNLKSGPGFAHTFVEKWPQAVDIILSPSPVGDLVDYDSTSVMRDLQTNIGHPIREVYLTRPCNTGQRMWDPLCVIAAVEGDSLITLSPRGALALTPQNTITFTPQADGNCRYQLIGDATWVPQVLKTIRQSYLLSAPTKTK